MEGSIGDEAMVPSPGDPEHEEQQIESRRAPSASIVYETIRREGDEAIARPALSLGFSGLAAGLSMGFSLIASAILYAGLPDVPQRGLIVPLGYTIGFVVVILGRQQLFTENTLTPILTLLAKPNASYLRGVARLWGIVLCANIAGAAAAAGVIAFFHVFDPDVARSMDSVAGAACCFDFRTVFFRGVFAGWLIALMVWLLPAAEQSRLWIIILLTYLVAAGHLSHIVAGSVELLYGVFRGLFSWNEFWMSFFIPTLLGNITGGLVLVAALNYGQVFEERNRRAPGASDAEPGTKAPSGRNGADPRNLRSGRSRKTA